jgi:hypothetical protein
MERQGSLKMQSYEEKILESDEAIGTHPLAVKGDQRGATTRPAMLPKYEMRRALAEEKGVDCRRGLSGSSGIEEAEGSLIIPPILQRKNPLLGRARGTVPSFPGPDPPRCRCDHVREP